MTLSLFLSWLKRFSQGSRQIGRADSRRRRSPLRISVEILEDRTAPAMIIVTSNGDSGAGTLRQAIADASVGDTISFQNVSSIALQSPLEISKNLTIEGPGSEQLSISGQGNVAVFTIDPGVNAAIADLTVTDGNAGLNQLGGDIFNAGNLTLTDCVVSGGSANLGGGVFNDGPYNALTGHSNAYSSVPLLTVYGDTIFGNMAQGGGGGIFDNGGTLSISDTTISQNTAGGGAGIANGYGSTLTVTDSTISGNSASGDAGGIGNGNGATATVTGCTISGNSSGNDGGGINNNGGPLTIINSTLANNRATAGGGGIYSYGHGSFVKVTNSTIAGNSADDTTSYYGGGGILVYDTAANLSLINTIVAKNTSTSSGPDVRGPVTSLGHNLIGNKDGGALAIPGSAKTVWLASDLTGTTAKPLDPLLGPLQMHGGPTPTMALQPASPAIDAGNDSVLTAPLSLATDQRGQPFARLAGNHVDIGAYEAQSLTLTVDENSDVDDGNYSKAHLSLREAIDLANANPGANTIQFDTTVFPRPNSTITLTSALPQITGDLTINGLGAGQLSISGNNSSTIFVVGSGAQAILNGFTLENGSATNGLGGAIINAGNLTVNDSTLTDNHVFIDGGAIYSPGNLTLNNTTLSNNTAGVDGGAISGVGIFNLAGCLLSGNSAYGQGGAIVAGNTITLTSCNFSGNTGGDGGAIHSNLNLIVNGGSFTNNHAARFDGGAIVNFGSASITGATISGNSAVNGGGIANHNFASVTDVTFSGNSAIIYGGGFWNGGAATLTNCTLSDNSAADGGGFDNYQSGTATLANCTLAGNSATNDGGGFLNEIDATVTLTNTILANGSGGDVASAGTLKGGHNVIEDGSGGLTDTIAGDPMLGSLAENGGPTETMALLPGSPAIDAGNDSVLGAPLNLSTDQRGTPRESGAHVDIGAYELQWVTPTLSVTAQNSNYNALAYSTSNLSTTVSPSTATGTVSYDLYADSAGQSPIAAPINAGTYYVQAFFTSTLSGFTNTSSAIVPFTIAPLAASVTPNAASKTYGSADPSLTGALSGFVPTDNITATYSRTAGESVQGGPYTISATLSPTAALSNYVITYNTANFTITPAPLVVTADTKSMTYGGSVPALTFTYNGLVNGDSSANFTGALATTATSSSPVSTYPITENTLAATGNYTIGTFQAGTLTVNKAHLIVIADNQTETYNGQVFSPFTMHFTGFVNGDTVQSAAITGAPTLSGSALTAVNASTTPYTIHVASVGTLLAANYDFTPSATDGSLTINKATLTVTGITAGNKVYDGTSTATINKANAALVGVIAADAGSVRLVKTAAVGAFFDANAGMGQPVYISGLTIAGAKASNYQLVQPTTTANITPKTLTVTGITANSKVYDGTTTASLNTAGASLVGVVSGDVGSVTLNTNGGSAAFANANVGNAKAVTVTGLSLDGGSNYVLRQPTGLRANITKASPSYSLLSSPAITHGSGTTATISAHVGAGSLNAAGSVVITITTVTGPVVHITRSVAIDANGNFSTNFTRNWAAGAYRITYHYAGNADFNAISPDANTTLVVN